MQFLCCFRIALPRNSGHAQIRSFSPPLSLDRHIIYIAIFEKQITDAPIFIYIHGGYWHALDKTVSAYAVQPLIDAGHKVIVLDYDLCPNITLEQLVDQVQRAGIFIVNYAAAMQTK